MASTIIDLVIHHRGRLIMEPIHDYIGGETKVIEDVDTDKLSLAVLRTYVKQCGYIEAGNLFYKAQGSNVFEAIFGDESVINIVKGLKDWEQVHIYVAHVIARPIYVDPNAVNVDEPENESDGGVEEVERDPTLFPHINDILETLPDFTNQRPHIEDWTTDGAYDVEVNSVGLNTESEVVGAVHVELNSVGLNAEGEIVGPDPVAANEDRGEADLAGVDQAESSSSSSEDDEAYLEVPQVIQEAVDNHLSDVDEELIEVRSTVNKFKKAANGRRKKAADSFEIPLGHAGIDAGFEDLNNDKSKYSQFIGGDEDYYGSSDIASFCSGESDGVSEQDDVPNRSQRRKVCYDPNCETVIFKLGLVFENIEQCREALSRYQVKRGVTLKLKPNDSVRLRAECKDPNCSWILFASVETKTNDFIVKKYNPVRQCHNSNKTTAMNSRFIAKHYKKTIVRFPAIRIRQIQEIVKDDYDLYVGKTTCRRAKLKVIQEHMGNYKEEFARLYDYRDQVLSTNPGSACVIKVNKEDQPGKLLFSGFYVCFKVVKDGFLEGCRKCIRVDGSFLRGVVKGQILVAVAKDGNHQMYPIAWAIVRHETSETWRWFLSILQHDLGMDNGANWTIMNMQKGLINAVDALFPEIEHRMCARHILANWSKKWRGIERRKKFWAAARSPFEVLLKDNLKKLNNLGNGIVEDLLHYNKESWCRTYFRTISKCDVVDNNMSETFNGWILDTRYKTIIIMLEEIRVQVMNRIHQLRNFANGWNSDISPMAMKVIMDNTKISMTCNIQWNGDTGFQVVEGDYGHIVDLKKETCSCRVWELKGIPCAHAICAMNHRGFDSTDYVAHWYHKETYLKAYSQFIQPITNMKMWPESENPLIEPPVVRKMPGRPKKNRRREHNEPKHGKLSRRGLQMKCTNCHVVGHNKASCKVTRQETNQEGINTQSTPQTDEIRSFEVGSSSTNKKRAASESGESTKRGRGRGRGKGRESGSGRGSRGGSGKPRGRPRGGGRGKHPTPSRDESAPSETTPRTKKRPRMSGYGVYVNERTGWTCSNLGMQSQRVVSTGSTNVQSSATVTIDIGFKPHGLKWKGKDAITRQGLVQKQIDKRNKVNAVAAKTVQPRSVAAQTVQPRSVPPPLTVQATLSAQTNVRPPTAPKKNGPATVVQWRF